MNLRTTRIGTRLIAGFGTVILIGLLSAFVNNHSINKVQTVVRQVSERNVPSALLAEEMAYSTEAVQQYLTDVGATRDPAAFQNAEESAKAFKSGLAHFRQLYTEQRDDAALARLQQIEQDFDNFYTLGKAMARAYMEQGTDAGNRSMREFDASSKRIAEDIRDFKTKQRQEAESSLKGLTAALERTRWILWLLTITAAGMGMAVSWFISRSITRPLGRAVAFARSVAGGDLSRTMEKEEEGGEMGELAESLSDMSVGLSRLVASIRETSAELGHVHSSILEASQQVMGEVTVQTEGIDSTSSAITEINVSIREMAGGMERLAGSAAESSSSTLEMAATVEEVALNAETLARSADDISTSVTQTASSIRQIDASASYLKEGYERAVASVALMDGSIRQVEQNARETAAISTELLRDAESGEGAVAAAMAGMKEIRRSSAITAEVISTLSRRVEEIGSIVAVIDEVAEQTELLALNAAIIAAQAGDQGKGFAVVAEEIKDLAERTGISTREIGAVIRGVQAESARAVAAIAAAERSIADGEQLSQQSGAALAKIVGGMKTASRQVEEIAGATVRQAVESSTFRHTMEQIAEMVSQIARATTEQRKGSELIMGEVVRMRDLTAQVRNSTREQSASSTAIAQATNDMTEMVLHLKRASDEQSRGSGQIVRAAEGMKVSTVSTMEAVQTMQRAISNLSRQLAALEQEVLLFRLD